MIQQAPMEKQTHISNHIQQLADPAMKYFQKNLDCEFHSELSVFRVASLFVPWLALDATVNGVDWDLFTSSKFLEPELLPRLKVELLTYRTLLNQQSVEVPESFATDCDRVLSWWKAHSSNLPTWFRVLRLLLLVQPSSTVVERVFSLLQQSIGDTQARALDDMLELSVQLRFNQ